MKQTTIPASFAGALLEGALRQGYDSTELLRAAGIPNSALEHPKARLSYQQFTRLSHQLMRILDDESFGMLSKPLPRNSFKHICYSVLHASNIREALYLFAEAWNLFDLGVHHSVSIDNGHVHYEISRSDGAIHNDQLINHFLQTIHRTLCWLANSRLAIETVCLDFPKPSDALEYKAVFFGAPLRFSQAISGLIFSDRILGLKNVRDLSDLKRFLRQMPLVLLVQDIPFVDLSSQVRAWAAQELRQRQRMVGIDATACHFGLHPQTLRRRLKQEATSMRQIKMQIRRDLAIRLIIDTELSTETIAARLGFSELPAFINAFKSWTSTTPGAYRQVHSVIVNGERE